MRKVRITYFKKINASKNLLRIPTSSVDDEYICPIREIKMPQNNVVAKHTSTQLFLTALSTISFLFIHRYRVLRNFAEVIAKIDETNEQNINVY